MKRFLLLASICAFVCAAIMSSCKKDDPAPVITVSVQPVAPANLVEGSIAGSLTVAAAATEGATLTYQWFSNTSANSTDGTAIEGATGASYTLPTDLAPGEYYYFCEIGAEGAESVRTGVVTVTVNEKPAPVPVITIGTQPAAPAPLTEGSIPADTKLTVAASVTEGATPAYQWYTYDKENEEVFEAIEGATGASYTLPTDLTAGQHWYICEISAEGAVSVQTNPVAVTVKKEDEPELTYTITASSLTSFGSLQTPYTQPASQTVTITNTGTGAVTLTPPTSIKYDIGALSATELAAGATAAFTVQPKANLAAGAHNEVIDINGTGGAKASISAQFTVTEATPPPAFIAVTDITGIPATMTVGVPLTLTGTVEPMAATNQTIMWGVSGTSAGLTASVYNNTLTVTGAEGEVSIVATIINGKSETEHFSKSFTIIVEPNIISGAALTVTAPVADALVSDDVSGVDGANFTVSDMQWMVGDGPYDEATFGYNTIYHPHFILEAKPGYVFDISNKAAFTINGISVTETMGHLDFEGGNTKISFSVDFPATETEPTPPEHDITFPNEEDEIWKNN